MSSNPSTRTVEQVLATGYRIDSLSVLSRSWELVKAGLVPMVIFGVAVNVVSLILAGVFWKSFIISPLFGFIIGPLTTGAYMVGARRLMLGQTLVLADFKDLKPLLIPIIVVGFLSSLLTGIGFILCLLPGIYASIVLGFAMPLVIDRGTEPIQAIKDSAAISRKSLTDLTILITVMSLVGIVGFLACGVGVLVAMPLVATMRMVAYADIMGLEGPTSGGTDQMPVRSGGDYSPPGFVPPPSATPAVPSIIPPMKPVDPVNPFGDDDHKTTSRPPIDLPQ